MLKNLPEHFTGDILKAHRKQNVCFLLMGADGLYQATRFTVTFKGYSMRGRGGSIGCLKDVFKDIEFYIDFSRFLNVFLEELNFRGRSISGLLIIGLLQGFWVGLSGYGLCSLMPCIQ